MKSVIEKLAEILLRYVGFSQKNGLGVVHIDEETSFNGAYP